MWTIYRPSRRTPRILREVKKKKFQLPPLYMAATVQIEPNQRLKLDLGVISCANLVMDDPNDPTRSQFPMVSIYTGYVTLAHSDALEGFDIPTIPYLFDKRDAESEELAIKLPTNKQLQEAVAKILTNLAAPQFKANMDLVRANVLKENWCDLRQRLSELEKDKDEEVIILSR